MFSTNSSQTNLCNMCPGDKTYILKASTFGAGAVALVENREWRVKTPPQLQGRGSCVIKVIYGSIAAKRSPQFLGVTKLWLESNIPTQGFSTEVTAGIHAASMSDLFVVSLDAFGHEAWNSVVPYTSQSPMTFYCPGGLPNFIDFRAMVHAYSMVGGASFSNSYLYDYADQSTSTPLIPQIEFHLEITFE